MQPTRLTGGAPDHCSNRQGSTNSRSYRPNGVRTKPIMAEPGQSWETNIACHDPNEET